VVVMVAVGGGVRGRRVGCRCGGVRGCSVARQRVGRDRVVGRFVVVVIGRRRVGRVAVIIAVAVVVRRHVEHAGHSQGGDHHCRAHHATPWLGGGAIEQRQGGGQGGD